MNDYEVHETAMKFVCKEIQDTLEKIEKNGMSEQMLDRLDKLYHTKKDILAVHGMEHPEEYYEGNSGDGMSGYRGRSPMTGRYVSRDVGQSYTEGYSKGYTEAMNQIHDGNSGHVPASNPYYPEPRRW